MLEKLKAILDRFLALFKKEPKRTTPVLNNSGADGWAASDVAESLSVVVPKPPQLRVNKFPEWKAERRTIYELATVPRYLEDRRKAGGPSTGWLDAVEIGWAREAGYKVDPDPVPPGVDMAGTDLSDFALHRPFAMPGGYGELTFTFTLKEKQRICIATCAMNGTFFEDVKSRVSGPVSQTFTDAEGRTVRPANYSSVRDIIEAEAGSYSYSIGVENPCQIGIQITKW